MSNLISEPQFYRLSKDIKSFTIQFNPTFEFHEFTITPFLNELEYLDFTFDVRINVELLNYSNENQSKSIPLDFNSNFNFNKQFSEIKNKIDKTHKGIKFTAVAGFHEGFELICEFKSGNSIIKTENPFKQFNMRLNDRNETKIFFSGKFGSGKTTFLNLCFGYDELKHDFETIKIYPVNFSVSNNEDIFRYIKIQILIELLARIPISKAEELSKLKQFLFYLENNQFQFGKIIIEALSKLHISIEKTANAINFIEKIKTKFEEHKKAVFEHDPYEVIQKFLKTELEKEGSIFEEDAITNIIRELLNQFPDKKTVLIIDDLDRLDPEHIFRILNVFSAHFDYSYHDDCYNKFGFDKIILVGDIKNIESIYHHRYGEKTDFDGYMNKFYSRTPFEYDNQKAINSYFFEKFSKEGDLLYSESLKKLTGLLLKQLTLSKIITLRDLKSIELNSFENSFARGYYYNYNVMIVFYRFMEVFSKNRFLKMLITLKTEQLEIDFKEYLFTQMLFLNFVKSNNSQPSNEFKYSLDGKEYEVFCSTYENSILFKNEKPSFSDVEFNRLLDLHIKELRGLSV